MKPVSRIERIWCKEELFTLLVRKISNEIVEAKVKGELAKGITLKNTAINFDKRSSKTTRKNRSMEVRIKIINELLYMIWDVMIFQNSRNKIVMDLPKAFLRSRGIITTERCFMRALLMICAIWVVCSNVPESLRIKPF